MIKAFIFDFGRVISAQKPLSLFDSYEKELGLRPGTLNDIMFGSEKWQDALLGRKTYKAFWHAIASELGFDRPEHVDAFRRRYHADERVNKGVLNIIRQLYGQYRLAVLSNSPPGLGDWLASWEMLDLFDVVFCSGEEGMLKPDPAVYRTTLKRLGVQSEEAVFIDDTPGHVEAANDLGLHGILFTNAETLVKRIQNLVPENSLSPSGPRPDR